MLHQIDQLCKDTDGRYATDAELMFFQDYLKTARVRFALYQKIQRLEPQLIQKILNQLKATDPTLLQVGSVDMTAKWQRDTVRVFRYAASALITDDSDTFKEKFLIWFQTIMNSFEVKHSCEATYRAMQAAVSQSLSPEEAALFCPLLEMTRSSLGRGN
jgi:hypothetical protein